jgi:acyl-coenzyme A thioesterase PaaI-like protein
MTWALSLSKREASGVRYHNSIPWITDAAAPGLHLPISWDESEAVLSLTMPRTSQAAPGITHGGYLSAIADHVMGFVAAQHSAGGVMTRQMVIDYLAPTPTSRPVTIRARAGEAGDRTVSVTLECRVEASGQVTFRATGSYVRISPSNWSVGVGDADYDTLEDRFDPSQVFRWVTNALQESYVTGGRALPLVIALTVADARPQCWTVTATAEALEIEPREAASWDVRFTGTVRSWREFVYRVKSSDELVAAGAATIEDPRGLLPSFVVSIAS